MNIKCDLTHKKIVRRRLLSVVASLDDAHGLLEELFDSFDLDDVRQDDFVSDAQIEEHIYSLVEIMTGLSKAVRLGGLLDEHFDRELVE